MYIASFILFGSSVILLSMGFRRCYDRKDDSGMRRLWEIRDDPFLYPSLSIDDNYHEEVNDEFYKKHHDVVNELRRDFIIVDYVDRKVPKVIRNLCH